MVFECSLSKLLHSLYGMWLELEIVMHIHDFVVLGDSCSFGKTTTKEGKRLQKKSLQNDS